MQIQEVEKEEKVIKKAKGWTRLHGEVGCVSRLLTCAACWPPGGAGQVAVAAACFLSFTVSTFHPLNTAAAATIILSNLQVKHNYFSIAFQLRPD